MYSHSCYQKKIVTGLVASPGTLKEMWRKRVCVMYGVGVVSAAEFGSERFSHHVGGFASDNPAEG